MSASTTIFPLLAMVSLVAATASLSDAAHADDFQQGRQISLEAVFKNCPTGLGVTTANCLGKQEGELQVVLKASVARELADIAKLASQRSSPGMLAGAPAMEAWTRDFRSAQASWEAYDRRQCENLFDYDFYGGSAAGMFRTACRIRHLVALINELAEP